MKCTIPALLEIKPKTFKQMRVSVASTMAGQRGGGKAQFSSDPVQLYINDNSLRLEPCQEKLIKVSHFWPAEFGRIWLDLEKKGTLQKFNKLFLFKIWCGDQILICFTY